MHKNITNKSKLGFSLIELSIAILIIGILTAAIFQSGLIVSGSKLSSARNLTKNSPVNAISDELAFWLETTLERSFNDNEAFDQNPISNWKDISPMARNYFHFSQTGDARPLYIKNAINGLPALRFDGVNDNMVKTSVSADKLTKDGNQVTIFLVQKYYSPGHGSSAINWRTSSNVRINLHAPSDEVFFFDYGACCSSPNGRMSFTVSPSYYDRPNIISVVRRTDGFAAIRINGQESLTSAIMTSTINLSNSADFLISRTNASDFQKGDIAEIIIFKTGLTNAQIAEIEKYLSDKWNILLSS